MKTTIDHVTEGELNAELVLRDAKIHSNANAIAMVQGNLDDIQSQLNAVKDAINSMSHTVYELDERITALEALHASPEPEPTPQPDPLPDPQPVEFQYTVEGVRSQFKYPPSKITDLPLKKWSPPLVDSCRVTEDTAMCTAVANAMHFDDPEVVKSAFQMLKTNNTDFRRWYDNDVHGRSKYPFETVLHLKLATLGDHESIDWLNAMLVDDRSGYSPYKIHNTLCALAPLTGGIQQAGKHYDEGFGKSYEGMMTGAPFFLLYCWYWMTGEDLISSIPTFRHLGRSLVHRFKPYHGHDDIVITDRGSFTAWNCVDYADETQKSGLEGWPRLPFGPFVTEWVQKNQWWWNCGDGVLSLYDSSGVDVDVTYSLTDSARSTFYPRCYAATKRGKGLLWAHSFKGNCTPRSCSGLFMDDFVSESIWREADDDTSNDKLPYFFDNSYRVDRPNDPMAQSEFVNPAPVIEGRKASITYPRLHNRRGALAYENPFNATTSFELSESGELQVVDNVTYSNAHPLTLSFTLSSIPEVFTAGSDTAMQCDGFSVQVSGSQIKTVHVVTETAPKRDDVKINDMSNPYNLEAIKAQVFVEFEPSLQFNVKTTVTWE